MSINVRQAGGNASVTYPSSTITYSFSTLPNAGSSILVGIAANGAAGISVTGVADNQGVGNVYTLVAKQVTSGTGEDAELWWCRSIGATSGTFTLTATLNQTNANPYGNIGGLEATGINAVDQTAGATANAVLTVTATAAAPNANAADLVIGVGAAGGGTSPYGPPTTGYTAWYNNTANLWASFGYKIVAAVETSAATTNWNVSTNGVALVATFTPANTTILLGQACL